MQVAAPAGMILNKSRLLSISYPLSIEWAFIIVRHWTHSDFGLFERAGFPIWLFAQEYTPEVINAGGAPLAEINR